MKKKKIIFFILLFLGIISLVFVYNDDFLYKKKILKVTAIKTLNTYTETNELGLEEEYYIKEIKGIITNTKDKNTTKTIKYEESYSSVVTDRFRVGDKLILDNDNNPELKRDFYLTILIVTFIILMYLVGEYNGLLSIVTVLLNIIIFLVGLELYFKGANLLLICIAESIIFSTLSLFISTGINKKTISSILSVFVSTIILLLMTLLITKLTNYNGINFNELSFLTIPPEDIIIPELLIGTLGAVMDVAITISSSIKELIDKDEKITNKNLIKSAKQIGKDIMTTMSNVLFFTYLCGCLPLFILSVRNGFSIINYISTNFSLEIARFLIGSIGIIMTIPITTYISLRVFRGDKHE